MTCDAARDCAKLQFRVRKKVKSVSRLGENSLKVLR